MRLGLGPAGRLLRVSEAHSKHLRTINPVESPFAAVRLRTAGAKRYKKVENATAVIWKTLLIAQKTFRRLDAPELLAEVAEGVVYVNGERVRPSQTTAERGRPPPELISTPLDRTFREGRRDEEESSMRARLMWALAVVGAFSGLALAQSAPKQSGDVASAREKFSCETWRLAWMEDAGPDGTITRITDRKGTLMYTRDGRMSVQIQFPESQSSVSNDYVLSGYEASFGTYEVNEEAQTITRHVEGSITRGLVGRRLTRAYRFSDGRLIMRSVRPDRWSTTSRRRC